MLKKLACSLLIGGFVFSASAQTATTIQANKSGSAYTQNNSGAIVRSPHGLCWRTSYWTPEDAVIGCDGVLAPPIANSIAPAFVAKPEPAPPASSALAIAPAAPVVVAPAPKRCDFSAALASKQTFSFNNAALSTSAKQYIDAAVLPKLAGCAKIDRLIVIGHTDRIGSALANQKLSEKRANAVAAYLKISGAHSQIEARGAGSAEPVTSCPQKTSKRELIRCLAPDRRVVITVEGTAK